MKKNNRTQKKLMKETETMKLDKSNNFKLDSVLGEYINNTKIPAKCDEIIFSKISSTGKRKPNHKNSFLPFFFLNINSFSNSLIQTYLNLIFISCICFLSSTVNLNKINTGNQIRIYKDKAVLVNSNKANSEKHSANTAEKIVNDVSNEQVIKEELKNIEYSNIVSKLENIKPINNRKEYQMQNSFEPKALQIPFKFNNFNYEFRLNKFTNLNYKNMSSQEEAILKDFSIGLWYELNHSFKMGAEFRQESFTFEKSQKILGSSEQIIIKNMNCWEMGIKYLPDFSLIYSRPYIQFNIGGGSLGLVTRLSTGIYIPITYDYNIIVGGEINNLLYLNNSAIQSTQRLGFNLGFSVNLK